MDRAALPEGEFDAVYLVFNEFKSAITQKVVIERLLPLADDATAPTRRRPARRNVPTRVPLRADQRALLERLVPMYVEISIYRALLESQASFFGAQMTAMDAATRNAKEMIAKLTLDYNRARQAAHHQGADGDHRRRRGAQGVTSRGALASRAADSMGDRAGIGQRPRTRATAAIGTSASISLEVASGRRPP